MKTETKTNESFENAIDMALNFSSISSFYSGIISVLCKENTQFNWHTQVLHITHIFFRSEN